MIFVFTISCKQNENKKEKEKKTLNERHEEYQRELKEWRRELVIERQKNRIEQESARRGTNLRFDEIEKKYPYLKYEYTYE